MKKIKHIAFAVSLVLLLVSGCEKALEVDLPIEVSTAEAVYGSTVTAASAMRAVYKKLQGYGPLNDADGTTILTALVGDEFKSNGGAQYQNLAIPMGGRWNIWYREIIYQINSVIEGVAASKTLNSNVKDILTGEARFTRAFSYFNLVNIFGDVPLVLNTDFKTNVNIARSSTDKVYEQMVADLLEAQLLLPEKYLKPDLATESSERVVPTKFAATALLARVYLYTGQWEKAIAESNKIIERADLFQMVALDKVFLMDSKEAIFQLQTGDGPVGQDGMNTTEAKQLIPYLNDNGKYNVPNFWISDFLLNEFEAGDKRKDNWINFIQTNNADHPTYPIAWKYKVGPNFGPQSEYYMLFRLGEQYLIRAEARAHTGNVAGAFEDLKVVRERAGLGNSPYTDVFEAIAHERYIELFAELGHRWFDLKRTGKLDARMTVVMPTKRIGDGAIPTWEPFKALMGIPYTEFKLNKSLIGHQNPGYREN